MGSTASTGKKTLEVIARACGAGKTLEAARIAVQEAPRRPVVYVAPSRALLAQFESFLKGINPSIRTVWAVGRKPRENCTRFEVFLYPYLNISPDHYCATCPDRADCLYISSRSEIQNPRPGSVYLSTYHFVVYNVMPGAWASALVIYDEMPPAIWTTNMPSTVWNMHRWIRISSCDALREEVERSMEHHIPPFARRFRKAIIRQAVPKIAFIPSLPMGDKTCLLTATPIVAIIRAMFPGAGEILIQRSVPLAQVVVHNHSFLPHSAKWQPTHDACGFKKNTAPGMPYFRASVGLGNWRGIPLMVMGTDSPPPYVHILLAVLLRARRLNYSDVVCQFDAEFEHPFTERRSRQIETAVLCLETDEGEISPVPYEITMADLVQLLGRSGKFMEEMSDEDEKAIDVRSYSGPLNVVSTSLPLRARNTHFRRNYVNILLPGQFDPGSLLRDLALYAAAKNVKDPANFLFAYYPMAADMVRTFQQLLSRYRQRLERMNRILEQARAFVREKSRSEQGGHEDGNIPEEIPF